MKFIKQILFYTVIIITACLISCKKDPVFRTYDKPELTINTNDGRLANDAIHFFKDTVYILATNINRNKGQKLIVDAGTLVKVNDGIAITINQGARIEAVGSVSEPIVFTSSAYKGTPGYIGSNNQNEHSWLGIAIYGNYPNLIDSTAAGTGILNFVRIEFAGRSRSNSQGLPSLLLQNVGRGTTIKNIQISYSVFYSSFQISGGNFNATNLISYASCNSDFNLLDGYKGMLQNILAYRHPYFSPQLGSGTTLAGLLISGDETFPVISNMTVLGPDLQLGTNLKYLDTLRPGFGSRVAGFVATGGQFRIHNSVVMGFPEGAVYIDGKKAAKLLENGQSNFWHSLYHSNDSLRTFYLTPKIYKHYTSQDLKILLLRPPFGSQEIFISAAFMFTDPFNFDVNPNPFPKAGSPVLTGADFTDDPLFTDPFFNKVTYRGAIGTDNWLQGWTNFIPLQTNYNN